MYPPTADSPTTAGGTAGVQRGVCVTYYTSLACRNTFFCHAKSSFAKSRRVDNWLGAGNGVFSLSVCSMRVDDGEKD